jgi:hypothetical protein
VDGGDPLVDLLGGRIHLLFSAVFVAVPPLSSAGDAAEK